MAKDTAKKEGAAKPKRKPKVKASLQVEIPATNGEVLPLVKTDVQILPSAEAPSIVVDVIKKVKFIAVISHKGVKDKDGELVDPNGNIYGRVEYENEGSILDYARIAGRIAQMCYAKYQLFGKGINRRAPFVLEVKLALEDGKEKMLLDVQTRLSNPIDTSFNVSKMLMIAFNDSAPESYQTGNFEVHADGALYLRKLGMPNAAQNLPDFLQVKLIDEKRKVVKKNVQVDKKEVMTSVMKSLHPNWKPAVKKPKAVATPAPTPEVKPEEVPA